MSKTNVDDLDLAEPGIEAREINSESAPAGAVLTANGAGGAQWAGAGVTLLSLGQGSEATISTAHRTAMPR